MAMYPQWSKEIAEVAEMYYERIRNFLSEMQRPRGCQSTSPKEENW
jgi:hypothetical protein